MATTQEFSPSITERRALLSITAGIQQLQSEGSQILNEIRARLSLPEGTELFFDPSKEKLFTKVEEKNIKLLDKVDEAPKS